MSGRIEGPLDAVFDRVPSDWRPLVDAWRESSDGRRLIDFIGRRLAAGALIYPSDPLRALALTPRASVRIVVLGQDPYHGAGQAEGLAFSVPAGQRPPPSLRNIFAELTRDLGLAPPAHGHLGHWASQGVLLLNTCLTVEDGLPAAHAGQGWEALTDSLISAVATDGPGRVFMLWGAHAQSKAPLMAAGGSGHAVLRCNHPSPLSARRPPAPFIGCGHFGQANRILAGQGETPVDWGVQPEHVRPI